ncbi:MAG TPA: AraC family transcriptional regulator [Candidatus Enterococcus avicola]|uniref:AraC family transcriptional regulator n=1 Tax=Candidatus Enterococcus avicola TaxID=2838561 RepID=A0A9D2F6A2_9ENTE|nr:AraC family transcriptional regulator [Candidatus Enterococcus avicola]
MKQLFLTNDKPVLGRPQIVYMSKVNVEDQGYPRTMHAHRDLTEVILMTGGQGDVFIGEQYFAAKKGDLLVYNSGVLHDELFKNDPVSLYCIGIKGLGENKLRKNALIPDDEVPVIPTRELYEPLKQLFASCYRLLELQCNGSEEALQGIFSSILILIRKNLLNYKQIVEQTEKIALVQEIKHYIDEHFFEDFKVKDLQEHNWPISEFYFAHKFKELYSYTPIEYIRRRRIGEAQTLLINTNQNITEIAIAVGFNSSAYFCTTFKKMVNLSPKQYRKQYTERKQDS